MEVRKSQRIAPSERPKSGYLPTLDGWRAVAILAVMFDHDVPWPFDFARGWHEYGGMGVSLFFAISGFLVCSRILEDEAVRGSFRVKAFYIRRIFRIQPPALVYVIAIAVLAFFGVVHERRSALLGAAFLYQNYLFNPLDTSGRWYLTGHFWSLAVEEHFYILLSLLLFCFKRFRVLVFALLFVALFLLPEIDQHTHLYTNIGRNRHTEFQLPYLILPALCALLLRRQPIKLWVERHLRFRTVLGAIVVVRLLDLLRYPWPPPPGFHILLWIFGPCMTIHYSFTFLVLATVYHPRSLSGRILELAPLRFIGRMSYSLYLWHALFFLSALPGTGITAHWLVFCSQRPWRYAMTFLCAYTSYMWIEKPFIRLGHRLAPPVTPGHRDSSGDNSPFGHRAVASL